MALGGGTWLTQNKKLPGTYINFVSKVRASVNMADRGYAAMPVELDWGPEGTVFTVTAEDFQKDSMKYFGYDYGADEMAGLRDLYRNLKTGYFYRVNNGAVKASNTLANAKYGGIRGNQLSISITANVDDNTKYDVVTYLIDGAIPAASSKAGSAKAGEAATPAPSVMTALDKQTIGSWDDLKDNDYVTFLKAGELADAVTAGMPLTGGTNGSKITAQQYQDFLEKIEPYYFNILGVVTTEKTIQDLMITFCKRLRDDVGAKFQLVLYGYEGADYEGVISIKNRVTDSGASPAALVWWLTGAEASCAVNASCTNKTYDGDYTVDTNYKQSELEKAITDGMLIFHRVTDAVDGDVTGDVNILRDINSFTSFSKSKNEDFSSNQVIRVLDQHAIDIARLFNRTYLGKEPNDVEGRTALWGDIVAYEKEMQRIRAIQNFVPDDVPIPTMGQSKEIVMAEYAIQPVMCMEKLYMTIVVA